MKNKGFTLVELLAVIVVIAILSALIIPRTITTIFEAEKSANLTSARNIVQAAEYKTTQNDTNGENEHILIDYTSGTNIDYLDYKGKKPISGAVEILENGQIAMAVRFKDSCYLKSFYADDVTVIPYNAATCNENSTTFALENPALHDPNPGIICGNEGVESYDDISVCYIYSVEDLMEFASLVNSGKNFQGKTVMLMNDLDINSDNSYVVANRNSFGDINEDGSTETTLKAEITTGKGFKPIGNSVTQFAGLFEGNAKKINNLYINRSDTDYVGLIAYNTGTIRGLIMESSDITGNDNVGTIAGYSTGNITGTMVSGNITGNNYLGLAVGNAADGRVESVVQGDITSSFVEVSSQTAKIGGITGYGFYSIVRGINLGGTLSAPNAKAYKTVGAGGTLFTPTESSATFSSKSITGASEIGSITDIFSENGVEVDDSVIRNIVILERTVDTYIGGDNNHDGYYYENDASGNILLYKLSDRPLSITMAGSGTSGDPYIITNYNQLKEASYDPSKCYRLDANIDLTNQIPIMLASSDNRFTGTFDGNTHSISNMTLIADYASIGLFGYNAGTIKGLKMIDATVAGDSTIGVIAGFNQGSITDVIVENGNVTGSTFLGLAVGHNGDYALSAVVSGNITSSFESTENPPGKSWVGGITGAMGQNTITGLNLGGTISTIRGEKFRTVGFWKNLFGSDAVMSTGASETVVLTPDDGTGANISNPNGKTYTTAELQTLAPYEEVGLNTSSETGEYRYALDSNYHPYLIKN